MNALEKIQQNFEENLQNSYFVKSVKKRLVDWELDTWFDSIRIINDKYLIIEREDFDLLAAVPEPKPNNNCTSLYASSGSGTLTLSNPAWVDIPLIGYSCVPDFDLYIAEKGFVSQIPFSYGFDAKDFDLVKVESLQDIARFLFSQKGTENGTD